MAGQIVGGLLVTANLFGSGWRAVFLINVPIGVALLATGARLLPHGAGDRPAAWTQPGWPCSPRPRWPWCCRWSWGQPEHWPVWGWICLGASVVLFGQFAIVERRVEAHGGSPLIPGRVLSLPGVTMGVTALFVTMAVFGGFFFALALHLQGGLGHPYHCGPGSSSPLPRPPSRWSASTGSGCPGAGTVPLIIAGFAAYTAGLLCAAGLLHGGGTGGVLLYLALALIGAGMAAAFSPLMTAVLMRVPVADAADATGVVVTVNQLAIVIGVATFGTLYLNQAGPLPGSPAQHAAFTLVSAHAVSVTFVVLAAAAVAGGVLALARMLAARRAQAPAAPVPTVAGSVPVGASPAAAGPGGARDA